MTMKYYSFFSGIGCFEYAIHDMFENAQCLGYSKTSNDLVIGGFPCTDLSSLNAIRGNREGLNGKRSGLFYDLVRILKHLVRLNPNMHIIIENV